MVRPLLSRFGERLLDLLDPSRVQEGPVRSSGVNSDNSGSFFGQDERDSPTLPSSDHSQQHLENRASQSGIRFPKGHTTVIWAMFQ